MNESCHIPRSHATSHVKYLWVMSNTNESCNISMSHVTYQWVMSNTNASCHISMSHVTYPWVMSHIHEWSYRSASHVTYQWVMSHANEPCYMLMSHVTYRWVMLQIHESCHRSMNHVTCQWVMSHSKISMSPVQYNHIKLFVHILSINTVEWHIRSPRSAVQSETYGFLNYLHIVSTFSYL